MTTILITVLWILGVLLVIASLLPLSKIPHGIVRGLAFPREQFFGMAVILAVLILIVHPNPIGWIGGAVLVGVAVLQAVYIGKFTPIWSKQSVDADADLRADVDRHISILSANVKKSNHDYDKLIALIHARSPDIVLAIEVDEDWIDALKEPLGEIYPHWVEVPKGNGYGICVMSHLKLTETNVREVITKDVPSVRTTVHLRNDDKMRLYVVHPEPPIIDHDTLGRDSEIAEIGIEADQDEMPLVVAGDLNDVAWSTTTRRFQRLSGLLDPRVGRGFYNTFSATMPMMRWPLDHLFHDRQFRLLEMSRLGKIGSDHFPMWFVLALAETQAAVSDPGAVDAEEARHTKKRIAQEKERSREAIGSDWEDED